jgi:predicted RNA-binding protein associated with RNAse of E/G family
MLKRKYGDRSKWKRVIKRDYTQAFFNTVPFKGYISLLYIHEVSAPLIASYGDKGVCIVDDDFILVQHFPDGKHYSLTTMFNSRGEIVQWYIDICLKNGLENNVPFMEDLFLDIVVLASGEIIEKDADELEAALSEGIIDESLYKLAWNEFNYLVEQIKTNTFGLINLVNLHKNTLLKKLSDKSNTNQ